MPASKRQYDIVTIGSAVRDIFLWLSREDVIVFDNPANDPLRQRLLALEYKAKISAERSNFSFGGGALNAALTFSRLGFKTAPLAALGFDDTAEAIENHLKGESLDLSLVSHHSTRPTGFSVIIEAGEEREHVVIVERGANNLLSWPRARSAVATSTSWYYTTTLSGEGWPHVLEKIVGVVKSKRINWAWNPGAEQLLAGFGFLGRFLKHCTVFQVNRDEALELLQSEDKEIEDDINHLLTSLLHWGPKMVIITDGRAGAYWASKHQRLHIGVDKNVVVKEATGAGDAFGSGFVAGLLLTKMENIPYALDVAMCNAESVLGKIGAQAGILRLDELKRMLRKKKHKIRKM